MASTLYQAQTQDDLQNTLASQMAAGDTSLTLTTSAAGIVNAPGVCVIDRVDSSGNKTPTAREYVSFTGVSTVTLSGLTRGLAGSTAQAHNVGAIVEFVWDVVQYNALYNVLTLEHGITGQHLSLASTQGVNTLNLVVPSLASVQQLYAMNLLNASGASIQGFPLRPNWYMPGVLSGASTALGSPLAMPDAGTIQYAYVTARTPASQASLSFDIQKNFSSILASSNILTIPINGTFASTASIATNTFNRGDIFSVGPANVSSLAQDVTLTLVAR